MSSSPRIAITGFPGWLSIAMLARLEDAVYAGPLVLFAQPSQLNSARTAASDYALEIRIAPLELGVGSIVNELKGVETLIHTAAVIHVRQTADWYRINTKGTVALARDARAAGVRRFVYISSIAAAGQSWAGRHLVETDEARPLHHYGRSKLLAERSLLAMNEPGVFEVVILRPSMFYGPPVPLRHVAIYRRLRSGRMPLVGGGNYNRSLVHISNLVELVWLASISAKGSGEVYYAVDRDVYTTKSIIDAMASALDTTPNFLPIPEVAAKLSYQIDRAFSMAQIYVAPIHLLGEAHWHQGASCEKAIRELGYNPTIGLHEGMRSAIDWCKAHALI